MEPGHRASDADRDRVAAELREHYGAGRLNDDELSQRLERVYAATSVGDLATVKRDLPDPGPPARRRRRPRRHVTRGGRALRASVKIHAAVFVLVNALLVAIWALTGGGTFWPVWSLLGWGVGLGVHAAPLLAGVGTSRYRTPEELADRVNREKPSLGPALAADGAVTIAFTDIVGSTEINDRLGDHDWLALLRTHHATVRSQIAGYDGYEVKEQGDGFMIAFPTARDAVRCGQAIHRALARDLPDIQVRIGIHTGEAVREADDFYGRNVVLAARLAAAARPGETLVSDDTRALVGDAAFDDGRAVELKGLGPTTAYAVT